MYGYRAGVIMNVIQDRCHRIGQTRQVTVYKLVTTGTVDEDIYEMGERKRLLSEAVLSNKQQPASKAGKQQDDIGMIGRILQGAIARMQQSQSQPQSLSI
jgi:hypothetical protein